MSDAVYSGIPLWVLSASSALVMAGVAVFLWLRRPPAPLWPIAFVCQLLALLWVLGDLWACHATSLPEKQIALAVLYSGGIPIAAAWWTTARRYVAAHGLGRPWMDTPWALLPAWYAAAAWLLMITNPWHGQFFSTVVGEPSEHHWGATTAFYANYAIVIATFALCAWAARLHASPDVRRKMGILAVASVAPVVAHVFHLASPNAAHEDATAIGLGLASAAILYGVYRKRLFNPLPVALPEILRRDPAGLLLLDRGGQLLMWNPAAERLLEGIPLEPDIRLLPALARQLENAEGDGRPSDTDLFARILEPEPAGSEQRVFRYVGGSGERWLQLSVTPIPTRRGHRIAAVCLRVDDVTELERAAREHRALAEQVRHVEKLKSLGLMAGGVAHDFNNLLTAITGNASLALEDLPEDTPARASLEEILAATELAADLTRQLLSYAGRSQVEVRPVALSKLVQEMNLLLGSSLSARISLRTDLAPELPLLEGDPTQLQQVVLNLVTNAAEAIGEEPGFLTLRTVAVRLDAERLAREGLAGRLAEGEYVLLEVLDNGCGMDEETRRRIFDPFFSTKFKGRGLGLAAVFGIVRAHGGEICAESEPGRGTTFRIWLPACAASAASEKAAQDAPPAAGEAWQASGCVLVVDDQERVRRVACSILERVGFDVLTASDGLEAIESYRKHAGRIRLVLLDLTMPEMGGEEALREILRLDPQARVILTSGFDETDAMSRLSPEKLGGFLHKPYRPEALLAKVRQALEA